MSSNHDLFCSVCRTQIKDEEESINCNSCQYQFHSIHLGYWVKANGDCPNCKTHFSSSFVETILDEIGQVKDEIDLDNLLMSNYWATSSCLICSKIIYVNDDECRCLNCGRDSHLSCILGIASNAKFPSVACPDCGDNITPLTHLIDNLVKREQNTYIFPQSNIWFPFHGFSQLHFHNNGSVIDYITYNVDNHNDSYPRYFNIYLNNSLYSKDVISRGKKQTLSKLPNNITKVTLQINFGAWRRNGWLLEYISDEPSTSRGIKDRFGSWFS